MTLTRPLPAVEEAVRLRERNPDSVKTIKLVTIGPSKAAETLRTGLAMGADSGIHIETPEFLQVEPLGVAKALEAVLKKQDAAGEKIDLVIMGKQAIDDDMGQTGQVLAGLLGWGQATFASSVTVSKDEKTVNVKREIDGGMEELAVRLPAVITTDLRYARHTARNFLTFDSSLYVGGLLLPHKVEW